MELNLEQGKYLVKLARRTIEEYVNSKIKSLVSSITTRQYFIEKIKSEEVLYPGLEEPRGVFCTLNRYPQKELRGCIGLPYPDKPLKEAVISAAIDSTQDPRFSPLGKEELEAVTIELSILTKPELIEVQRPEEYLEKIEQGKNGLILQYKDGDSGALVTQGLFLPQVWEQLQKQLPAGNSVLTENKFKELFLAHLCYKANIFDSNAWRHQNAQLLKFQVQIFEEKEPKGEVEEKSL
ncbi:MAG: TIGR00296 family protein [Candidatus Aenigmarchaeota archaeon]|nr:TIGR00296 family protein [Candidatus Aenigmarchaeota archaeon]